MAKLSRAEQDKLIDEIAAGKKDVAAIDPVTISVLLDLLIRVLGMLFKKKTPAEKEELKRLQGVMALLRAQEKANRKAKK